MSIDETMGKTNHQFHFSLLQYMNKRDADAKEDAYDLFYTVRTDPKQDVDQGGEAQRHADDGEVVWIAVNAATVNGCGCVP
jgi:hypothetical protein